MTFLLLPGVTLMPPSTASLSGCHSRCSWGLSALMTGRPGLRSLPCCFCGCAAGGVQCTSGAAGAILYFEADTALTSTSSCATNPTCLWLPKPHLTDTEMICSRASLKGLQPNVLLPAGPSAEQHSDSANTYAYAHTVGIEAEEDCYFTCKVDVCHIAVGHASRGNTWRGKWDLASRYSGTTLNSEEPALQGLVKESVQLL